MGYAISRRSVRQAWRLVWLPLVVWLAATAVVFATCALTGRSPFGTAPWIHWDAYQYLDISRHGYALSHCFLGGLLKWCGNAGWFPAYPWLIRAVASVGLDHAFVAVALSWLFDLSAIVLLWVILDRRTDARAVAVLVFASFAPGLVYDYAAFPLSMLAFLTLLYLWLIKTEYWVFAGLVVFTLVLTYPTGLAAPLAVAVVLPSTHRTVPLGERWRRVGVAAGPAVVALVLFPILQQRATGHWDAYYLAQVNFGTRSSIRSGARGTPPNCFFT